MGGKDVNIKLYVHSNKLHILLGLIFEEMNQPNELWISLSVGFNSTFSMLVKVIHIHTILFRLFLYNLTYMYLAH